MAKRFGMAGEKWQETWRNAPSNGFAVSGVGDPASKKKPEIEATLLEIIKPEVAGDPVSGQCWLRRSLAKVRQALGQVGVWLATRTIRRLLRGHKIRPKSNV